MLSHLINTWTHSRNDLSYVFDSKGIQGRGVTSSGTARILVNPFLNTTNTFLAPQRRAEVQQSKAVSPAPSTIAVPDSSGNLDLQPHIPIGKITSISKRDLRFKPSKFSRPLRQPMFIWTHKTITLI